MVFSERACSGAKRNNEVLTTPHIPARKFSLFHFSSKKKKSLFCSKKSALYLLRTKEIVIPLLPKRGYYPIIPKKNSVILIPIFLFKALACIIGNRAQKIVHFVFRTRKTSFSPTRFFGIKRKQQQQ